MGANNVYDVIVRATDGTNFDDQAIAVTITNVNDNSPVITSNGGLATASVNVAEGATAVTTVTSTDADGDARTYELNGGDDVALFAINGTTGALTFLVARDFESPADVGANNVYDVIVRATDGTHFDDQAIAVTITNVNEAPVITSANSATVNENQTAVLTVTSSDVDGNARTYSITGGDDAAKFSIVGATGVLTFLSAPDFENKLDVGANNIYDLQVTADDGLGGTDVQNIVVTVADVAGILITSNGGGVSASVNAPENSTTVTTVAATDEGGAPPVFSLSNGADQGKFDIDANSGVLTFKASPNFESPIDANTDGNYLVEVTATGFGGATDVQTITVTVTNVNEIPTDLAITQTTIAENAGVNAVVGALSSTDPDAANTFTYTLVAGVGADDNASFNLSGNSLRANADFDFETLSSYTVRVRTTDQGGLFYEEAIAITVINVNEAPSITSLATANSAENQTGVITVTATDPDVGATAAYSLTGGADQAKFFIDGATGVLTFQAAPDFESKLDIGADNIYNVTVQVSDGALSASQNIAVTVTNVNEIPTDLAITQTTIAENAGVNAVVGALSSTDPDAANTFTYTLVAGVGADDNASFNLSGNSLRANADFDFETLSSYTVRVRTTDQGGLFYEEAIAITVINSNEPPVITSANTATPNENQTAVLTVTSTDVDGGARTYSITGGADQANFVIVGATGVLTFVAAPNFESPTDIGANNVYDVTVTADDGLGGTVAQNIAVTVINVNEVPSITSVATASVAENQTAVLTVISSDPDAGATALYSISGGVDASKFAIDGATGILIFVAAPNFEAPGDVGTDNVYNLTVQVSDGFLSASQNIAVTVTDVNEVPAITSASAVSVAENQTAVLTVTSTDPDAGATALYSISGGVDASKFAIAGATGILTFVAAPDFEAPGDVGANNVYNITVQVSDGTLSATQNLAVTVTNVNEAPVITSLASATIAENQTAVLTVTSTDLDGGARTYTLSGGADQARFAINAVTGALTFAPAPDFELPADANADNRYLVQVTADDGLGGTVSQIITVDVTNVNDNAPVISSNGALATADVNVAENTTAVTVVSATDADGSTPTFALNGGADASKFTIDATTGVLSFATAPDFETALDADAGNDYVVVVRATDGLNSDDQILTVHVTNVNESPVITSLPTMIVNENQSTALTVQSFDVDGGAPAYGITGGVDASRFTVDVATGVLSFVSAPDFEIPGDANADNQYQVQVSADDGLGGTGSQAVTVIVSSVNEAPTNILLSNATVLENAPVNAVVGVLTATDPDQAHTAQTNAFTLPAGMDDNALFNVSGSNLRATAAFDFETRSAYVVTVRVADQGGLSFDKQLSVTVANVNELPVITSATAVSVPENQTAVLVVASTDVDGGVPAYSISGGADQTRFAIDAATGVLAFADAPDFENSGDVGADNVYNVQVSANDGLGGVTAQNLAVTVTNVNEAPAITSDGALATAVVGIPENAASVTTVTATDPDAGTTLEYSLAGGADQALFQIGASSGQLAFVSAPDYESGDTSYQVMVRVTDGVLADTQTVTVAIGNVNDNAPVALDDTLTVAEDTAVGSLIGTVSATDADGALNALAYSIVSGNTANAFAIGSATGAITLTQSLDFETLAAYVLSVRVTDGVNSDTTLVHVDVTDVFEFDSIPAGIVLVPDSLRLLVGVDSLLRVIVRNAAGDTLAVQASDLSWSSTLSGVATVTGGTVSTQDVGTASVVVALGSLRDTCRVTVAGADTLVPPSKDTSDVIIGGGIEVEVVPADTALRVKGKPYDPGMLDGFAILGKGVSFLDSLGNSTSLLGAVKVKIPLDSSDLPAGVDLKNAAVFVDVEGKLPMRLDNYLASGGKMEFLTSQLSRFFVAADTLPPKVAIDRASEVLGEQEDAQIDFSFEDNIANSQVELLWKVGGDTTTHSRILSGSDLDGQVALAYSDLRSRGAMAWLKAFDGTNETKTSVVDVIQEVPHLVMEHVMPLDGYDMFSVPFMKDSMDVLGLLESQLGPYNPKKWRAYETDTTAFKEVTEENNHTASAGKAYWLRTKDLAANFAFDSLKTYPVSKPVEVVLHPGWNSISTPHDYDVSWSAVKAATGADTSKLSGIYGFDPETKTWSMPDTTKRLKVWSGYLVKNLEDTSVVVKVPNLEWSATNGLAKTSAVASAVSRFTIRASQQGLEPGVAYAGISALAKVGVDAQDFLLPPVPGVRLSVYFKHTDWGKYSGKYMSDMQPASDSVQSWDFQVGGFAPNQVMHLDLDGSVPAGSRAWVVDQKNGRVTEWTSSGLDVAAGAETSRQFSLVLSKTAPAERFVARLLPGTHAEVEVFGREVVWSIPESLGRGMVQISVVGVNGQFGPIIAKELQDPGVYRAALPADMLRGAGYRIVMHMNNKVVSKAVNLHLH